jgi:hypothetical protein
VSEQRLSPVGPPSAKRPSKPRPEAAARDEFDLRIDAMKLALNIANCSVGGYLSLSQAHHLIGLLVRHSRAFARERVAVEAIRLGSFLAQLWQRSGQFTASLL